jgi:hypothetical protein
MFSVLWVDTFILRSLRSSKVFLWWVNQRGSLQQKQKKPLNLEGTPPLINMNHTNVCLHWSLHLSMLCVVLLYCPLISPNSNKHTPFRNVEHYWNVFGVWTSVGAVLTQGLKTSGGFQSGNQWEPSVITTDENCQWEPDLRFSLGMRTAQWEPRRFSSIVKPDNQTGSHIWEVSSSQGRK